jgi:DsbC/DsbD-like thiol-disulfide interchange protein
MLPSTPFRCSEIAACAAGVVAAAAALLVPLMVPAHGAETAQGAEASASAAASAWDKGMRSAVRLIAAAARPDGNASKLRAGVEMRLDPGWKTYWRYPGDSGVPPRFTFARSDNVKTVVVGWPAPHRFVDASGQAIGYKGHVIFPLQIEPQDTTKPTTLRLDLEYAICEKLCVPAEAKVELVLAGNATAHDAALAAAEARVPQRRQVGEGAAFSIRAVKREAPDRIVVDVVAPPAGDVDLFAEGPTAEWALPLPTPLDAGPGGGKRFAVTLDGLPAGAKAEGAALTFTAVAKDSAIEATYRLP